MKEQNLTEEERQATIDKWSRYIQETRHLAALGIHVNNARGRGCRKPMKPETARALNFTAQAAAK